MKLLIFEVGEKEEHVIFKGEGEGEGNPKTHSTVNNSLVRRCKNHELEVS